MAVAAGGSFLGPRAEAGCVEFGSVWVGTSWFV